MRQVNGSLTYCSSGTDQLTDTIDAYQARNTSWAEPMLIPLGGGPPGEVPFQAGSPSPILAAWAGTSARKSSTSSSKRRFCSIRKRADGFHVKTAKGERRRPANFIRGMERRAIRRNLGVPGEDLHARSLPLVIRPSIASGSPIFGAGDSARRSPIALADENRVAWSYTRTCRSPRANDFLINESSAAGTGK